MSTLITVQIDLDVPDDVYGRRALCESLLASAFDVRLMSGCAEVRVERNKLSDWLKQHEKKLRSFRVVAE